MLYPWYVSVLCMWHLLWCSWPLPDVVAHGSIIDTITVKQGNCPVIKFRTFRVERVLQEELFCQEPLFGDRRLSEECVMLGLRHIIKFFNDDNLWLVVRGYLIPL